MLFGRLKLQDRHLVVEENDELGGGREKLMATVEQYLKDTDLKLTGLVRDAELLNNPLFRCLDREIKIGIELLNLVRSELTDVYKSLKGVTKPTQQTRVLIMDLSADKIPKFWSNKYFCPPGQSI